MSYKDSVAVVAAQDLRACQYQVVGIGGTIVATGTLALGILQNNPNTGEDATVAYTGRIRAKAGAAVTAGARVTVTTSGYVTTCTSNQLGIGTALESVSSGGIFEGIFNFAGAKHQVNSAHLA